MRYYTNMIVVKGEVGKKIFLQCKTHLSDG